MSRLKLRNHATFQSFMASTRELGFKSWYIWLFNSCFNHFNPSNVLNQRLSEKKVILRQDQIWASRWLKKVEKHLPWENAFNILTVKKYRETLWCFMGILTISSTWVIPVFHWVWPVTAPEILAKATWPSITLPGRKPENRWLPHFLA